MGSPGNPVVVVVPGAPVVDVVAATVLVVVGSVEVVVVESRAVVDVVDGVPMLVEVVGAPESPPQAAASKASVASNTGMILLILIRRNQVGVWVTGSLVAFPCAYPPPMATTRVIKHIAAPPGRVYAALTDPESVQRWMVPDGMSSQVHDFDAREGGNFRISLTYDNPDESGKTHGATDTFGGRFAKLVPSREVVQVIEFETDDPEVAGEMTITYLLSDADGGTDLTGIHENLPPGVSPEANELGWQMSIDKLARLVEAGH